MEAGSIVGSFEIEGKLGQGGMGTVYRARQLSLDRPVAVKFFTPPGGLKKESLARFHREARAVAQLCHPHIVQIYTISEHNGIPYFAMEYIEGVSLSQLVGNGQPLSLVEALEIVRAVGEALDLASGRGIIHRDIKTANLMVTTGGVVKLMDFGLAKSENGEDVLTLDGQVLGSPSYMSPEQIVGGKLDRRSDLYSLGCVLYECLTGIVPFAAPSIPELLYRHIYDTPIPPHILVPGIPPAAEEVCLKLLAKGPEDRYQTGAELLAALSRLPFNLVEAELALARRVKAVKKEPQDPLPPAPLPEGIPPLPSPHQTAGPIHADGRSAPLPEQESPCPVGEERNRGAPPPRAAPAAVLPADPFSRPPLDRPGTPHERPGPVPAPPSSGLFCRLPDGRWSCGTALGPCPLADRVPLAASPVGDQAGKGPGDCLRCSNWTRPLGCALAAHIQLERTWVREGLSLLEGLAVDWCELGQCGRAIALLEERIRARPEDPARYQALAHVYMHPNYRGPGRRRATLLYQRFLELGGQLWGRGFTTLENQRAHFADTGAKTREGKDCPSAPAAALHFFTSFYGTEGLAFFAFVVLTCDRLVLHSLGCTDPESGEAAGVLGGHLTPGGTRFSFLSQNKEPLTSQERKALRRRMTVLAGDPAKLLGDPASQTALLWLRDLELVTYSRTKDAAQRCIVRVRVSRRDHEFVFPSSAKADAERCLVLLERFADR